MDYNNWFDVADDGVFGSESSFGPESDGAHAVSEAAIVRLRPAPIDRMIRMIFLPPVCVSG